MEATPRSQRRRLGRWLAAFLALALAAGAGWWSAQVALSRESATTAAAPRVVEKVVEASIGESLTYNVSVTQPFVPIAANSLSGVVTYVRADQRVRAGDHLFSVSETPVFAVSGSLPFYRDLTYGDSGRDVQQVQQFLQESGFELAVDGSFGSSTQSALRAWQEDSGQSASGEVRFGTMIAIPRLPAAARLGDDIRVGSPVTGGEVAVSTRTAEPRFAINLSSEQAAEVPTTAAVTVAFGDVRWKADISGTEVSEEGTVSLVLIAPDGAPVCGRQCSQLPPDPTVSLLSQVEIVPRMSGPAVPVSAVRTDENGSSYVVASDDRPIPVTVRGSGDGVAIVEGVSAGTEIVVLDAPAEADLS